MHMYSVVVKFNSDISIHFNAGHVFIEKTELYF